jgi:D-serine deaminase-like pyridoxal phosphate-dependent protein
MDLTAVDTPALTVDIAAVERNVRRLQSYCDAHGLALRPHIKSHKLPAIAHLQVREGAVGITCQKLGEGRAPRHARRPGADRGRGRLGGDRARPLRRAGARGA